MMRLRVSALVVAATVLAMWTWRTQLFTVSRPGERPRALAVLPDTARAAVDLDVVLPVVPVGLKRLHTDGEVALIHYWAPWERDGAAQAALLDSLRQLEPLRGLRVVIVCFDPFPSVARYVARHRLRVQILLDTHHELRRSLPCPSIPYTYVIDRSGRVAVAQAGEVDWFAPDTRRALGALLAEGLGPPIVARERPARHAPGRARRAESAARHRPALAAAPRRLARAAAAEACGRYERGCAGGMPLWRKWISSGTVGCWNPAAWTSSTNSASTPICFRLTSSHGCSRA